MIQSMYTAAMGLHSQQRRIDTLANNLANVSTAGYKSVRLDFKDALYNELNVPVETGHNMQNGHGVLPQASVRIMTQGVPQDTGRHLDIMIDSEGYMTMQDATGQTFYTRSGALNISVEDGANYLVDGNGSYVLNTQGQRIVLPEDTNSIKFELNGTIRAGDGTVIGQLDVVRFADPQGLISIGDSGFIPSETSGPPIRGAEFEIRQGYLESSNVDMAQELQLLIRTQRAFSFASRALTQSDSMEGLATSMRG